MQYIFSLNRYLWRYRWRVILGLIFVVLANYFRILQPQEIRRALNAVVDLLRAYSGAPEAEQAILYAQLTQKLLYFAGMVLLWALLMGFFTYLMRQTLIVMSRLIEGDMRRELFEHYLLMDAPFFKKYRTGDLMSRVSEDIAKVRMYLGPGVMYLINLLSLSSWVIFSMFSVHATLALLALSPLPILSLAIYYISSEIQQRSTRIQRQLAALTSLAQESFSGIRVIKVFARESSFRDRFYKDSKAYYEVSMDMTRLRALFFPMIVLLIGLSNILTIYWGGKMLNNGMITAGNLAEFVIYINMLTWPFTSVGWIASVIQEAAAAQKRIVELLRQEPQIRSGPIRDRVILGNYEFNGVSFRYPDAPDGVFALKDIHARIHSGTRCAIVGKTGSGKSTFAELMVRIMDPTVGMIYLENTPLPQYDLSSLRRQVVYVTQDVFLFSDTIAYNIAIGQDDVSMDEIVQAAKLAQLHDDIVKLPQGYHTIIGERGVTLSGGQRQRLAIARAIIRRPRVLILDDVLSAIDNHTVQQILQNILQHSKQQRITLILITHNLMQVQHFDHLIVMSRGSIAAQGTFDQLMADKEGYFYKAYCQQQLGTTRPSVEG